MVDIGIYKRKLAKGFFWYFSGQYKGVKYHSNAEYSGKQKCKKAEAEKLHELEKFSRKPRAEISLLELCNSRLDYINASKSKSYYKDNKKALLLIVNNSLYSSDDILIVPIVSICLMV